MDVMSFKEFRKALNGGGVEGELLKTVVISLLTSFVTLGVLYFFLFRSEDSFFATYGFYLFFAVVSYALLFPSVRHVRAFGQLPCMSGMMVGMTIGMIGGFLAGFYVGATNGMFYGGVFGMAVGIFFGVTNGKCCGVMGVMEGLMSGFMGGLTGAMTAVMMINDNVKVAGVIVFLVCAVILGGLSYMLYTETRGAARIKKEGHFITIWASFILTIVTGWLMVYGPRGPLFG